MFANGRILGDLLDRTFAGTHRLGHTAPAIHRGFLQTRLADPANAESFWMLSQKLLSENGGEAGGIGALAQTEILRGVCHRPAHSRRRQDHEQQIHRDRKNSVIRISV
jgi:hypothetical protein